MKILIVEDEIISALALRLQLQNSGYEVCTLAVSCIKAVEICRIEKPDIALMDIRIKGEQNGIETARIISTQFNVPSIFMSGYEKEDILKFFNDNTSVRIMKKPVDTQKLIHEINSVLGEIK